MTEQSQVQIHIPQQLIDDMVRAEIVRALGNHEAFCKAMVQRALDARKNTYDKTTILEDTFGEMVREEAKKIFREWVEEHRELLKKHFVQALTDKKNERLRQMADSLLGSIHDFSLNVSLYDTRR